MEVIQEWMAELTGAGSGARHSPATSPPLVRLASASWKLFMRQPSTAAVSVSSVSLWLATPAWCSNAWFIAAACQREKEEGGVERYTITRVPALTSGIDAAPSSSTCSQMRTHTWCASSCCGFRCAPRILRVLSITAQQCIGGVIRHVRASAHSTHAQRTQLVFSQ